MAATIVISCPKCKKSVKAPAAVQGRRVRCKGCNTVFQATVAGAAPQKSPPAAPTDEEWAEIKAYGIVVEKDLPRCPYCAWELESSEAVVCLNCGYNLRTRQRLTEKILEPVTVGDYILWLLPGIACALAVLFFGAVIVILWTGTPDLSFMYMGWTQRYKWARVYGTVLAATIIWVTGAFAIRRLILNPHPPEREKKLRKKVAAGS